MRTALVMATVLASSACTSAAYTPLSYTTSDIEQTVDCARYVLPADVELLRKAGGWKIGKLEPAQANGKAASTIAWYGGTHFYAEGRALIAVHVANDKMQRLPEPLRAFQPLGTYKQLCPDEAYR